MKRREYLAIFGCVFVAVLLAILLATKITASDYFWMTPAEVSRKRMEERLAKERAKTDAIFDARDEENRLKFQAIREALRND